MYEILKQQDKEAIEHINSRIHGPEYLSKTLKDILFEMNFLLKIKEAIIYIKEGKNQIKEFLGNSESCWEKYHEEITKLIKKSEEKKDTIIEEKINEEIKHIIIIPINENGAIIGFLIILNQEIDQDNPRKAELIKVLDSQIKWAIKKSHEREEVFSLFGRYVDKRQIVKILENPDFLKKPEKIESVVLFADIEGFVRFTNEINSQKVFEFLSKIFYEYTKIINKNSGIVDKFVGDQIIGIFGILDKNNRSENAIKSAINIQTTMRKELKKYNLGIKISVVKGDMLYGNLGGDYKSDITVIGPAVNLASRICDFAKKDEILVNKQIYGKLKNQYKFKLKTSKNFKGFKTKETIYKLISTKR